MTTHPPLWLEANRAWVADHVHRLFAPLRGTRLDKEGRECPMCGGAR